MTLPKYKIVDCGAFYEVTFFCISPKNLLRGFFYRLNAKAHREPDLLAIRWSRLLRHFVIIFIIAFYIFAAKDFAPICCPYTAIERKSEVHNCWEENGNQDPYPYSSSWITDMIQRKSHPAKQDCYDERDARHHVDIFGYPKSSSTPKPEIENTYNKENNTMN